MANKQVLIWLAVVIILVAIFLIWWQFYRAPVEEAQIPAEEPEGLGAEIYSQTGAGAASDFPTANPTANPIEGVYQNPFE